MRPTRQILVALLLLLVAPGAAAAADFYVDDGSAGPTPCAHANPCQTVQQALDAAAAGGAAGASLVRSREVRVRAIPPPPPPRQPGAGNDIFHLGPLDDGLCGLAGSDRLYGNGGRDTLWGDQCGDSARRLAGAAAGDGDGLLVGMDGNDRPYGSGGSGDDALFAASGVRENVNCGSGRRDRAAADRRDKVKGCEKVKRQR